MSFYIYITYRYADAGRKRAARQDDNAVEALLSLLVQRRGFEPPDARGVPSPNSPLQVCLSLSLKVYISILLESCFTMSVALDSSHLLLSHPLTSLSLASPITNILIFTLKHNYIYT